MTHFTIDQAISEVAGLLNKSGIRYLLVGGAAVGHYGYYRLSIPGYGQKPTMKFDLDFWYEPTIKNFEGLINVLAKLGVKDHRLSTLVFDPHKTYLRIPLDHYKLEFLPQMKGLGNFQDAYLNAEWVELGKEKIAIIGYNDLVANKKAVNRLVDQQDLEALNKIRNSNE